MGHIFISYSHKDSQYARKLEKALKQRGFDVWIDERIDYGAAWPSVIQDHVDNCDALIVVASENSSKSDWVQNEVARAKRKGKPFFPLLLSGDPWISIETTQYVDVRDGKLPPSKFYDRLSRVMSRGEEIQPQSLDSFDVQPDPSLRSETNKLLDSKKQPSRLQNKTIISLWTFGFLGLIIVAVISNYSGGPLNFNMDALPPYSDAQWTAIASTQQVMARPQNERIRYVLNSTPPDTLEEELGQYQVTNVGFPTDYYFEVSMNCECNSGSGCCYPGIMFNIIMDRMASSRDQILGEVPTTVSYLDVVCFDHNRAFYTMYAPWDKVKGFLSGTTTASELSSSVTWRSMP
jgi:hypothetical protein